MEAERKQGKKGDASPPELKMELNSMTICINNKYTHQTPDLSYTYNSMLYFVGNMTRVIQMVATVDDSSCARGMTTTEECGHASWQNVQAGK
eukprot:12083851-Ditylum_brightwellii.AAC.1